MKKFIYMAVAAIAALSSCSSDDAILNEGGQNETGVTTFTATIEDAGATRATYNATTKKAEWEATTDKISIDGHEYTAQTTGATTAFTGTGAAKGTDEKYHAYFPASLYNSGTPTLPDTQTYTAGEFNMPMYAESTTTEFRFYNLCAVLAVKVASGTVQKIKVVADKRLHGAFTATAAGVLTFTSSSDPTEAERTLILDCGSSGVTANNTTFYIAIPAQTYSYLNIYLSADGTTYKEAMATKVKAGIGAIARNTIYSINYAKNAVQLWSDGPYFAEVNVSVYGNNRVPWQDGMEAWGANWTIPNEDQMSYLFNASNITFDWVQNPNGSDYGFKFTGTESGYTSVSLFLPAEHGNADYGNALYWSGTPDGASQARYVNLNGFALGGNSNLDSNWISGDRTGDYFVRLVLR